MLSSLYGAIIKSSVSTLSTNIKCTKSGKSSLSVNTPLLQDIFFSLARFPLNSHVVHLASGNILVK